jgi:hypothetical protein
MASSSIALHNLADADQTYSLVGSTPDGAVYKMADQELSTPRTLIFKNKLGAPGALGNDTVEVSLADSRSNEDTGLVKTVSAKLVVSIPRDTAITSAIVVDLLCQMADLLSDARNANLADAIVP